MKKLLFAILLCSIAGAGFATTWTTVTAGSINTLANWSDGASSPTTFANPGDTWNITLPMTMSSAVPWTVGTLSSAPVNVEVTTGGISGSGGSFLLTLNIYGNFTVAGPVIVNGTAAVLSVNVYGDYTQTAGTVAASGGGAALKCNVNGNFIMTDGSVAVSGLSAADSINIQGSFSMSGPSFLASSGVGATGIVRMSLPSSTGIMMLDNSSTGPWQSTDMYVDANCIAQLAGDFGITGGNSLFVNGSLICPAAYVVNGAGNFAFNGIGMLTVAHGQGVNGAITNTGTKTFSSSGSYTFNGGWGQATGTLLPTALNSPSVLTINNNSTMRLTQSTSTTGTLRFIHGCLVTYSLFDTFTLTVPGAPGAVLGANSGNFVGGILIKTISGEPVVNFEVGDQYYAPISFELSEPVAEGSIGVQVTKGAHPYISSSGIMPWDMANKYWRVTTYSCEGSTAKAIPTAQYRFADIVGGASTNEFFATQAFRNGAWLGRPIASKDTAVYYDGKTTPTIGLPLAALTGAYIVGAPFDPPTNRVSTVSSATQRLYIAPNPNKGIFTFRLDAADDHKVQVVITDVLGRKVKEFTAATNKPTDVIFNVAPGLYLLSANDGGIEYTTKLEIE